MRILQIGAAYVGAQRQIEGAIHRYLRKEGHESRILYAVGEADGPDIIRYETKLDNLLRRGLNKVIGKDHRFAHTSTRKLIRQIERYAPELVHLHTIHHGYLDYEMLLRYLGRKQIPVVFTMHDMWSFTGGCYHYTNPSCDGYKSGCVHCEKKTAMDCDPARAEKLFQKKKELFRLQKSICFVAVSEWVHDEAMKSMLKDHPQYTVWNAFDLPHCDLEKRRLSENEKFRVIGVAGSWDAGKGISLFLELAKLLGESFEILLVGNANRSVQAAAPANVRFAGRIADKTQLMELYAASDLHVSMSLEETFGMTFVEAAFAGIRSVGFDSTAIPGVLRQVNGYIVPAGDVDAMAEQIRMLSENKEQCRLRGDEMEQIEKNFSNERLARQYVEIYEKQIAES